MSEQQLQSKILQWLHDHGFYAVKVVKATRAGIPDIVGCTPKGNFFAIEVKYGSNTPSPLQIYNIESITSNNGIAFVTWSLGTVITKLQGEILC